MDIGVKALAILTEREKRAQIQKELLRRYNMTLVSFTLNIPGPDKNNQQFIKVHQVGERRLTERLKTLHKAICHQEKRQSAAGIEGFYLINWPAEEIKRLVVEIEEEHPLGRLFDFDVFDKDGKQVNRALLGLKERKCLLCDGYAAQCRRSGRHTLKSLLNHIYRLLEEYGIPLSSCFKKEGMDGY